MYISATKCQLLALSCFMSVGVIAKDVKAIKPHSFLNKPLCFVENKGQVMDETNNMRSDIQFKLQQNGLNLFVGEGELHYQFKKVEDRNNSPLITTYPMDVALVGANKQAAVKTSGELEYYENYFLNLASNEGITARTFSKITYVDVYPNIDWVIYVNEDKVEYDFVVRPGGNVDDIKVKYSGATSLTLNKHGGIVAKTPMGEVVEKQPYSYETGTGKAVRSRFVLSGNVVSFATGSYHGSLTIDPYLTFCTYKGGSGDDIINAVKVSPNAPYNIWVCGKTSSTAGFTAGAPYQAANNGGAYDAFFARYTSGGTLSYATYYGGTGNDEAVGITQLPTSLGGNVVITGNTTSTTSIASIGAGYQGSGDIFIANFNAAGTARIWSRYLGGALNDRATSIAHDGAGDLYVGGTTMSTTGVSTNGTTLTGTSDAYLVRINLTTGARVWATYYGGNNDDEIDAIALDASNNVVAVGMTNSVTGMATAGAAQMSIGSAAATDGFLARFQYATGARIWGSYVGGGGADQILGVALDGANNIYLTGHTSSSDSITSGMIYQGSYGGGPQDGFVQAYTIGGAMLWGTYLGGNGADKGYGVNVDMYNNVVVSGYTSSTSGLATPTAYQTSAGGGIDAYVAKFTRRGQNIFTSYLGQSGQDYGYGVSTDPSNSAIVLAGASTNATGFTTAGAQQTAYGGGTNDGFVARFTPDTIVLVRQSAFTDTLVCSTGTLTVYDTTLTNFNAGNVFTVQLSNASGSFASPTNIGTSAATATGSITCNLSGVTPGTGYRIRIVASNPAFTSPDNGVDIHVLASLASPTINGTSLVCVGQTIAMTASAPYQILTYSWSGPSGFSSALAGPFVTGSATTANAGMYSVTTTHNGCPALVTTFSVTVNTFIPPTPRDSSNGPVCLGSPIRLYANPTMAGTFGYYWVGPGGFTSTGQNPVIPTSTAASAGYYYVVDTLSMCPSASSAGVYVNILPLDTPNITITVSPNDTVCKGTVLNFTATTTNAGASPHYQWMSGSTTPIVGAIYNYYSSAYYSLGTAIRCVLTSTIQCPDKPTDTSNIINVTLLDNTPVITITASPDTFVASGSTVTFHAVVAGYSLLPGRWYVNNVPVVDSTTTLVLSRITHNDTVRYERGSSMVCANIGASNTIIVRLNTAVADLSSTNMSIDMLPNPNAGSFSIKGVVDGMEDGNLSIDVTNALGQVVYTGAADVRNGAVDGTVSLKNTAPGIYILRVSREGASKVFRFVVE